MPFIWQTPSSGHVSVFLGERRQSAITNDFDAVQDSFVSQPQSSPCERLGASPRRNSSQPNYRPPTINVTNQRASRAKGDYQDVGQATCRCTSKPS